MIDIFGHGRYLAVNTLGHATGILICATFLALMLAHQSAQQLRASRLSLAAAGLALVWNAASLVVIVLGSNYRLVEMIIAGIGFCALSILPSVLLDLCLRQRLPVSVRIGYGLSGFAVLAHVIELQCCRALSNIVDS